MNKVAVLDNSIAAHSLAQELDLPLAASIQSNEFILELDNNSLRLHWIKYPKSNFTIAFNTGMLANLRKPNAATPLLIKALALKKYPNANVLDLTAGWGEDGVSFALYNARVIMLERNPTIAKMLQYSIADAKQNLDWFANLEVNCIANDAVSYLQNIGANAKPDIIYYDPMYEDASNKAAVKKEMQLLRAFIGSNTGTCEVEAIVALARKKANKRVVLKRHRLATKIDVPDFSLTGKSTRFDVYLCSSN